MEYSLRCSCGNSLTVSEGAAGTDVSCDCGRAVRVPSFAELRSQAGLLTQLSSAPLIIEEMIAAGSLPTRADCARCGLETSETVDALAVWHIEMAKPEPDGLLGALCMISPKIRYSLTRHVEVVTLRFRVRLCPFCRWANAERSLRPRLFSILVFVIGACAVYWALWGFLLMAISLGIWVVEVSVVEQRRQSTLLGILHHEPIYKQVLEDCSPPVVSVVGGRVAEQPPQQWPPFASN